MNVNRTVGCVLLTLVRMLILGAVLVTCWQSKIASAQSQWVTNGNNINSTNTGNVGVGTATPPSRLTVQGPTPSGTTNIFTVLPGGTFNNGSIFTVSSVDTMGGARAGVRMGLFGDYAGNPGTFTFDWFNPASGYRGLVKATNGIDFYMNNIVTGGSPRAFTFRSTDLSVFGGPNAVLAVQNASGSDLFLVQQGGNVGIGTSTPSTKLYVAGDLTVTGNIAAKYQDVAEWVPSTQKLSAGTVVVLDEGLSNHVLASWKAYDTHVAGVISERPGLTLGEVGVNKLLVATTGRVRVRVDATRVPILIGDLIVTSDVEGIAMKSEPVVLGGVQIHRPGTIVGKALEPLATGKGEILVLLSLQ